MFFVLSYIVCNHILDLMQGNPSKNQVFSLKEICACPQANTCWNVCKVQLSIQAHIDTTYGFELFYFISFFKKGEILHVQ